LGKQKLKNMKFSLSSFLKNVKNRDIDHSRRWALAAGLSGMAAAMLTLRKSHAAKLYNNADGSGSRLPIMPPGAQSSEHFRKHCTACHLCVAKCPSQCIKPSFLEYGISGMMQPLMRYKAHSFCNYDCTICSSVCPTGALKPLRTEEKRSLQIGRALFDRSHCMVIASQTDCGACAQHCPTQAVRMAAYKNNLRIPQVDTTQCVGCGGCEAVCPARPLKAIRIAGVSTQQALDIQRTA
jgi:ferredoxin